MKKVTDTNLNFLSNIVDDKYSNLKTLQLRIEGPRISKAEKSAHVKETN